MNVLKQILTTSASKIILLGLIIYLAGCEDPEKKLIRDSFLTEITDQSNLLFLHDPAVDGNYYMPESIGLQVFNRFFSVKGGGRGLGTYSAKYPTEKYLAGEISYTSSEEQGTTFTAVYPLFLT